MDPNQTPPFPPQTGDIPSVVNPTPAPPIDTGGAPPVTTTPTGRGRTPKGLIATVFGLLLLVGGVGAGLLLVRQNQDIREKAAETTCSGTSLNKSGVEGVCNDSGCTCNNSAAVYCDEQMTAEERDAGYTSDCYVVNQECASSTPGGCSDISGGIADSYTLKSCDLVNCVQQIDAGCRILNGTQTVRTAGTIGWTWRGSTAGTCGGTATPAPGATATPAPPVVACQGTDANAPNYCNPAQSNVCCGGTCKKSWECTYTPQCPWNTSETGYPSCKKGDGNFCDQTCVNAGGCYNTCASGLVPNAQGICTCPSVPLPTDAPTANCTAVTAYDKNWNILTSQQLSQLSTGDVVRFTVRGTTTGGTFDKARFTINGTLRPEVTTKRPNSADFYDEYTVPAGTTSFTVSAQVHHSALNQWY